jgi:hypothetical protein
VEVLKESVSPQQKPGEEHHAAFATKIDLIAKLL